MREVDSTQAELLAQRETVPIYLIDLDLGDEEALSTNGDRVVGSVAYTGGDAGLRGVTNWSSATVTLRPSSARAAMILGGAWRGGQCNISLLPAVRYPLLVEAGYWEDGYALQGDVFGDPILLLPGRIAGARLTGDSAIELQIVHRTQTAKWSPGIRIGPPWCNHLPRPGTVVPWEGENFILEAA